jgi:hypothetical protein
MNKFLIHFSNNSNHQIILFINETLQEIIKKTI